MQSIKYLLFSAAVTLCVFGPSSTYAADSIGKVAGVLGSPTASGPGGDRSLSAGSQLFEGDTVKASNGGNVQIILDDGTRLVVGPASQLVLQSYLKRNNKTAKKVAVRALRGTFRFITGHSAKSAYKIETANATIGIRGTGLDLSVRDRTLAAVLIGRILLEGRNKESVDAGAGCDIAEAGGGSIDARLLKGRAKINRLSTDFPFIRNQGTLLAGFRLPVENCRSSAANSGESGGNPRKPPPPEPPPPPDDNECTDCG